MLIILGIIQSFLSATGMILTKKIVENKIIGNNLQTFFNRGYHLIIMLLLFLIGIFEFNYVESGFTLYDFGLLFIATIGLYITYPLRRTAYANEKISVLQPYAMLFQIFPIIIGFIFIVTERANLITFLSAIAASLVVILTSINYKNFKINKYSLMVLLSSIIKSFQLFAMIYFLTKVNPITFYIMETILVLSFSFLLMFIKKEFNQVKLLTKKYTQLLLFTNSVVVVSILISLTLFSTLGIILTSLLSLTYLVFVYMLSYLILKEIPSKKDVLVTLFVVLCVIIGVIFRN